MSSPAPRHRPAAGRALEEAELQQVGLVDVLDRLGLLAEGNRKRRESHRPAAEALDDAAQKLAVEALEPHRVDLEQREGLFGHRRRDDALVAHLRDIAYAPQDAVRDPRRPPRAAGDELGRVVPDLDAEDARRATHDRGQLHGVVVVEAKRQTEPVAERRRQQAGPRRRPDQRERRQVEREGPRGRPLPDDDVEPEVLERRVEDLLCRAIQAVDLVDEEDVARLQGCQDRRDVAFALERRACDLADPDAELVADDLGERRLPEPRRACKEHVVERLAACLRGVEGDLQLLLHALLPDEVAERARPERPLDLLLGVGEDGGEELRHAALRSTARTCSSIPSESSTSESARSATISVQPSSTSASRAVRSPPGAPLSTRTSFSFSSSTTRCAVFRPIPGIAWNRFTSSRAIARRSSAGVEPLTIESATLGPTPETPSSSSKSSRSSAVAKP